MLQRALNILALAMILFALPAKAADCVGATVGPADLLRTRLNEMYSRAKISRHDHAGILVEIDPTWPLIGIKIPEPTGVPWQSESWTANGTGYRFLNVGFPNLEHRTEEINRLIGEFLLSGEKKNLMLAFGPKRAEQELMLSDLRWIFHRKVINTYDEVKDYLTDDDLALLNLYNMVSNNNDVLGLMQGPSIDGPIEDLRPREISRDLKETIQISYFGDRDFINPTNKGVLRAMGYPVSDGNSRLPFAYRLDPEKADKFLVEFYGQYPIYRTCEMNRYVKFDPKLPKDVSDLFNLDAFLTAILRGMHIAIASVDAKTMKRFKIDYGFELYKELPIDPRLQKNRKNGLKVPEYLIVLNMTTPAFRKVLNRLLKSSEKILVKQDRF